MAIDPRRFLRFNVADTCSIWNILSSALLYSRASEHGCMFCCTEYVRYECLTKPRKASYSCESKLQSVAHREMDAGRIKLCSVEIEDLQQVSALADRKRLHRGELSTIAFAFRTGQAVLTDDQAARHFAFNLMGLSVQTVPHLLAWLVHGGRVSDGECEDLIVEHAAAGRPLAGHLRIAVKLARECLLQDYTAT